MQQYVEILCKSKPCLISVCLHLRPIRKQSNTTMHDKAKWEIDQVWNSEKHVIERIMEIFIMTLICRTWQYLPTIFSLFKVMIISPSFSNSLWPSDAILCQRSWTTLVQVMACCLFGTKPLAETMLIYCQFDPMNKLQWHWKKTPLSFKNRHLKMSSANCLTFLSDLNEFISIPTHC